MIRAIGMMLVAAIALLPLALASDSPTSDAAYHPAIGLINFQNALTESLAWQDFRKNIQKTSKKIQRGAEQNQKKMQKMKRKLAKEKKNLSAAAFRKNTEELLQQEFRYQQQLSEKTVQLDAQYANAQNHIREHIYEILRTISAERQLDLILNAGKNTNAVILANPLMDVTQEVVERLNQKLPQLDDSFSTP